MKSVSIALLFGLTQAGFTALAAADAAALDQAFARLQKYDWGDSREALNTIEHAVVAAHNDSARRRELEPRLAAVLVTPAPRAAKDFVCRQLSVVGTGKSIPTLAALLADAELSHVARFALERIPDDRAAAALRDALPKTQGKTRIGIINSLGAIADAKADGVLVELLTDPDTSITAAAVSALGKIGTTKGARALEQFRASAPQALQRLVTEAYVVAGERLLQKGQRTDAARIFREVFEKETADARLAGFRGLVLAEPKQAVRLLSNALAGDDAPLRNLAPRIIAELPGEKALKPFLDLLPSLPPAGQVALLNAIHSRFGLGVPASAGRNPEDRLKAELQTDCRSAVLIACDSAEPRVRLAALRALGVVGTAEDVTRLTLLAASRSGDEREAARLALTNLPGREPSDTILKMLPEAQPPMGVELIRALAGRGASEAATALTTFLKNPDDSFRVAALDALGVLGGEKQVTAIIAFLKTASEDSAFQSAGKSLEAIVTRAGAACRDALISGMQNSNPATQIVLLEQLGRVGGSEALQVVRAAGESGNAEIANAAIRALADWPDAEVLPHLLKLAQSADPIVHRETAFRGCVRLCRETPMPASERLNRLSEAAKLATSTSEKILIASALADVPDPGSLKLLETYLEDAALVDAASVAAVKVASVLEAKHKREVAPVLDRVVERCRNVEIQKQAKAILKKIGASND